MYVKINTDKKERDYLSEIDGKIGDGDHGINMNKGFTMCEKKLEGTTYNLSEGLTTLGETLLEDIGGSMGPLYGMLFDEMAQVCEDEEEITADVFAEICRSKRSRKRLCRMFGCYECRSRKRMAVYKRSCSQDRTSKPPWRTLSRCS